MDRRVFLSFMRAAFNTHKISLFAFCLMDNHFHLLLSVNDTPLGVPMQKLLMRYSMYFNRIYARVGHLFQSRYTTIHCLDLGHLIHLAAYIHLNPVRAGMVAAPEHWPWSSHHELIDMAEVNINLRSFQDACGLSPDDWRDSYEERLDSIAHPDKHRPRSLDELIRHAACIVGIHPDELTHGGRGDPHTRAKRLLLVWAEEAGYSDTELARALNCSKSALSQLRQPRVKLRDCPLS
jgi:REP element-mobilizing transposase RayT